MAINSRSAFTLAIVVGGLILAWNLWHQDSALSSQKPRSESEAKNVSVKVQSEEKTVASLKEPRTQRAPTAAQTAEGLSRFQANSDAPWEVVRNELRGGIKTLKGGRIVLEGQNVAEKARELLDKHSRDLFNLEPFELKQSSYREAARKKVVFQQYIGDVPVYGAQLALVFENEQLTRIQSDLVARGQISSEAPVSVEQLQSWFKKNHPKDRMITDPLHGPRLGLLPGQERFDFIYIVSVDEMQPSAKTVRKTYLIDAANLRLVKVINKTKS